MAPTRRKRGMSAAATAQWKLGDLVLAKMKGFPAWPAMISEPEQWGLASVKNMRLAYFCGTKQIAFYNYAELEAFTEEKQVNNFSGNNYQGYESREVAEEKWRRHGRKKWRNFLVITTLLLFMVGYVFYFI